MHLTLMRPRGSWLPAWVSPATYWPPSVALALGRAQVLQGGRVQKAELGPLCSSHNWPSAGPGE